MTPLKLPDVPLEVLPAQMTGHPVVAALHSSDLIALSATDLLRESDLFKNGYAA